MATGWTADPAAESRLRLATEALAGFLYDWDLVAGRVERIGGLEALVGVHPDEVSPEADWWSARIHPDDVGEARQIARAAMESGAAGYALEYRVRHRDGHYVDVADRARIVRDADGAPVRVVGGTTDVSTRRRAELERERLLAALEAERSRLADLLERAPAFIAVLRGPDHVYERANACYQQLIGHRDVLGRPVHAAVPELAAQGFIELLDRALATGEPIVTEGSRVMLQRAADAAPEERFVNVVYQPITEADGSRSGVLVHGVDVTEQVVAHAQLAEAQRIARIGTWTWDVVTGELTWSEEMCRMHGRAPGDPPSSVEAYFAHVHHDDLELLGDATERMLATGERLACDYRVVLPGGEVRAIHARGHAQLDARGVVVRVLGTCQDVTERLAVQAALRESEQRFRYQALHDPLTGLANRTLFLDRVAHALARAQRAESAVAILFLDLDGFKTLNDTLGHVAGDTLLVHAAERVCRAVRADDTVARLGGDEFAVLLEGTHAAHAAAEAIDVAERVVAALAVPIELEGGPYRVGASVGVAAPEGAVTTSELLQQADRAMYAAKARGGGRHVLYEPRAGAGPEGAAAAD